MRLDPDGAELFPAAFPDAGIRTFETLLETALAGRPGARLQPTLGLAESLRPATDIAAAILGAGTRPVRAMLFDKSAAQNWALGWHQDRTIAVRSRCDVGGFTDWTVKHGIHHVVPPFGYLERMLTTRIHLDPVDAGNAPLMVARGSHKFGRIDEPRIETIRHRLGSDACLAARGDLWLYRTPILHASARTERPVRRRVLQILYSADALPGGLEWLGV